MASYMNSRGSSIRIPLKAAPAQLARLAALQARFAEACNALAPLVAQTRCWNRVALHHMAYKQLRERFPDLGSQMVCNTIYSVSRISRTVYQHPQSPFNVARFEAGKALPRVQFTADAPVYFDRHTLSLKDGVVSLFTLDGRMRFELEVEPAQERRFREQKLREIVLTGGAAADAAAGRPAPGYALTFQFGSADEAARGPGAARSRDDWPEYVLVTADPGTSARPLPEWLPPVSAKPATPLAPPVVDAPRIARTPTPSRIAS